MGRLRADAVLSLLFSLIFVAFSDSVISSEAFNDSPTFERMVIPSSLVIPQSEEIQQVALFASGVQIYVYNGTDWALNNVSADLYNFTGHKVGYHYYLRELDSNGGRPTWETFHPASRVTGKRLASVSQKDSIEWVLLETTSQSRTGSFGVTKFIQRLFTQHGLPPGADFPAKEGDIFESWYSSMYTFFAPPS